MISWCALVLFLVCNVMPGVTDEVTFERATRTVVMSRQEDGGWSVFEDGEDLGVYYLEDGTRIRCVPPPAAAADGAEEFIVNIAALLELGAGIDWNTVDRIGVLDPRAGTPIRIDRRADRIIIDQRKGLLKDGVEIVWDDPGDFPAE